MVALHEATTEQRQKHKQLLLLSRFVAGSLARYARSPLWDFELFPSYLLAVPAGLKIAVEHGLEL